MWGGMNNCGTPSHLQEIGENAVAQFDSRIAQIPDNLRMAFNLEAMRLEDKLLFIYQFVVSCAREEEDLEKIASNWELMVGMCDVFSRRLYNLKESHPACGADVYYDRILDLRNKCHRLQEMHG